MDVNIRKLLYGLIIITLILFSSSGCLEKKEQIKAPSETTITTSVVKTTTTATLTTTTFVATTAAAIADTIDTTTTTVINKLNFTCNDWCIKENYLSGICRKTASQCRIYGVNEAYKPLGNRFCLQETGFGSCCCKVYVPEKSMTTTPVETTTTTILDYLNEYTANLNNATGFEKLRIIPATIKYTASDGLLYFKLLNVIGDIKFINITSEFCPKGVGLGNLGKTKLSVGEDTEFRAICKKLKSRSVFSVDLKFTYKEYVTDSLELIDTDEGLLTGFVE